jgi:hydroxymethylbilane synthase
MNATLNGGCQVPLAGYAVLEEGDQLFLRGLVGEPDGSVVLRAEIRGPASDATALGVKLAEDLISQGADAILARLHE